MELLSLQAWTIGSESNSIYVRRTEGKVLFEGKLRIRHGRHEWMPEAERQFHSFDDVPACKRFLSWLRVYWPIPDSVFNELVAELDSGKTFAERNDRT